MHTNQSLPGLRRLVGGGSYWPATCHTADMSPDTSILHLCVDPWVMWVQMLCSDFRSVLTTKVRVRNMHYTTEKHKKRKLNKLINIQHHLFFLVCSCDFEDLICILSPSPLLALGSTVVRISLAREWNASSTFLFSLHLALVSRNGRCNVSA